MDATSPTIDPLDALRRLTPQDIEARLDELRAEDKSLRVLLRSLRARESATKRREAAQ